jgi:hypothetical protein
MRTAKPIAFALVWVVIAGLCWRDCSRARDCERQGGAWVRATCVEKFHRDPRSNP